VERIRPAAIRQLRRQKLSGDVAAIGARSARPEELADELGLLTRALGGLGWSGRCCHCRGVLRPSASSRCRPDGGPVGGLAGSGERIRTGHGSAGEQGPRDKGGRMRRLGRNTCNTHALGTPSARRPGARRNEPALQKAPEHTGFSRGGL